MIGKGIILSILLLFVANNAWAVIIGPLIFHPEYPFRTSNDAKRDAINYYSENGFRFYVVEIYQDGWSPNPTEDYSLVGYAENQKIDRDVKDVINVAIERALAERHARYKYVDPAPIYTSYLMSDLNYNASVQYVAQYNATMLNILITEYALDVPLLKITDDLPDDLPPEIHPKDIKIVTYHEQDFFDGNARLPLRFQNSLIASDLGFAQGLSNKAEELCITTEEHRRISTNVTRLNIPRLRLEIQMDLSFRDVFLYNDQNGTAYFADREFLALHNINLINKTFAENNVDIVMPYPSSCRDQ